MQDPDFYEFLKEHDKELLQFNDEDIDASPQKHVFFIIELFFILMVDLKKGLIVSLLSFFLSGRYQYGCGRGGGDGSRSWNRRS